MSVGPRIKFVQCTIKVISVVQNEAFNSGSSLEKPRNMPALLLATLGKHLDKKQITQNDI